MPNLVRLTYRSTHTFLVNLEAGGKLMVDAGWPGALPVLKNQLRSYGIAPGEIKFVFITHMHPDHAGLAQEIKQLSGARLILHEKQIPFLPALEASFKGKGSYVPIIVEPSDVVLAAGNRAVLEKLGIHGEVIETPGHSDDSVSLVLDGGLCFIGDLHLPQYAAGEAEASLSRASWHKLLNAGATTFYPAHGETLERQAAEQTLKG